jgi:predicted kinase
MNKKIIIIAGYFASGKSTFALKLSKEINVPYLIKDTFKSAICFNLPITNREEGRRFSAATFDAIVYVTERFMEAGYPLIIEGNFVMGGYMKLNEGDVIKSLIERHNYQSLTYIFWGDTRIICDRFNEREKLPERGQANQVFAELTYDDCEKWLPPLAEFTVGGKIFKVDTTDFDKVDYDHLFNTAHNFMLNE